MLKASVTDGLVKFFSRHAGPYGRRLRHRVFHGLPIRGQAVIDTSSVLVIVAGLGTCWAAGFACGKAVAYVRGIAGAL